MWREKTKTHKEVFPKEVFPRELSDPRILCVFVHVRAHAIPQPQLRVILPSRSYQKMKAVPARFLQADNRQPPAWGFSHRLLSSYVLESPSHCRSLVPREQEQKETKEPGGWGREVGGFFLTPPQCSKGRVEARLLPISSYVLRQLFEPEQEKEGKSPF